MKELEYKPDNNHIDLSDRVAIELGIARKETFAKIAERLKKHPHTIAREIKSNRTHLPAEYPCGNDCKNYHHCDKKNLCGADSEACKHYCKRCMEYSCHNYCKWYESQECHKTEEPPYVCNSCLLRRKCMKNRFYYSAKYADAAVKRRRSESRSGVRLTEEKRKEMGKVIRPLLRKGQPLSHIYNEHEQEFSVSLRTLYNYIDQGKIKGVKNIDLRRKVGYKARRKRRGNIDTLYTQCREGRTYDIYEKDLQSKFNEAEVVEMDTVLGVKGKGKRLLTMLFRKNSIMLLFLMPNGKADSVIHIFNVLENGLGTERFQRLFPLVLTDNGSEFKRVDELERNERQEQRTFVFYCDPMASWQKSRIEKNHEYIRYVLPKGKTLDGYTQEDITLLMNHINSTKRLSLNGRTPYELAENDEDMQELFKLLKMHLIPADEVHLTPELFRK